MWVVRLEDELISRQFGRLRKIFLDRFVGRLIGGKIFGKTNRWENLEWLVN